jgi:hypothetical protein
MLCIYSECAGVAVRVRVPVRDAGSFVCLFVCAPRLQLPRHEEGLADVLICRAEVVRGRL